MKLLDPGDEITKIFENSETIYPTTNSDFLEDSKFQIANKTQSLRKYPSRDLRLSFTEQFRTSA
jgi:hypothetical protein